jgi:TRAP-type mannitol/chloroaromatic compound transport system permease small subunit
VDWEPWWAPLRRGFRAAVALVGHLLVALTFIICIWVVDETIRELWHTQEPLLWRTVPLRYLFDTLDAVVFGLLAFWGVVDAYRELRG